MSAELHPADAFTGFPFRGNTAAVCIPGGNTDYAGMQRVAAVMKHPETAFLFPF
jgi:predicted PhzF superfamily epimerase YddE/YHI9